MGDCKECGGHGDCRVFELMESDDDGTSVKGEPHCLHCAIQAQTTGDPPVAVVYKSNASIVTDQ